MLAQHWMHASSKRPFLIQGNESYTHADIAAQVALLAKNLEEDGLCAGDLVPHQPNISLESIVFILAVWQVGGVPVLFSEREPEETCTRAFFELCEQRDKLPPQAALIMRTSGSAGGPKHVVHSFETLFASARMVSERFRLLSKHRLLLNLPLYHVGGLGIVLRAMWSGAAVVLASKEDDFAGLIARHNVSHLSLVPTQLYRLLKEERQCRALSALEAVVIGGAALTENIYRQAIAKGIPLFRAYGLTETASQVVVEGKAFEGVLLKLVQGEILVKSPSNLVAYMGHDGVLAPFDEEGFFHTGDIGKLDEEGDLQVIGRKDNMMISGGENIHPEQIESVLMRFPGVEEAMVVPISSKEFGERPVVFVRAAFDLEMHNDELLSFMAKHLPNFKIPDHFWSWPSQFEGGMKASRYVMRLEAQKQAAKLH